MLPGFPGDAGASRRIGDIGGAIDVDALKRPFSALKQDSNQVDDLIGAVDGGGDAGCVGDIGGPRRHLTGIAQELKESRRLRITDGDANKRTGAGQAVHQMPPQKAGTAENGNHGFVHHDLL